MNIVTGLLIPVVIATPLVMVEPIPAEPTPDVATVSVAESFEADVTPDPTQAPAPRTAQSEASDDVGTIPDLAYIIEGEAPTGDCPWEAQLAVAHIAGSGRNSTWYGWRPPSVQAVEIARTWNQYPDPTHGATYLFSSSDIDQPRVQEIIGNSSPLTAFNCGYSYLYAYP